MKNVNPEDKVTIETTYGDLAKVVALFHNSSGKNYGEGLYSVAFVTLKSAGLGIDEARKVIPLKREDILYYSSYQSSFIKAIFQQETEEQQRIRELEETISKAQHQIAELKKVVQGKSQ